MAYTKHMNLLELPTGPVDWVAGYNDTVDKLERGRTVKVTAGVALAIGDPFYISTVATSIALKAVSTSECNGIMLSTASTGVEGYGQVSGVYTSTGSTWGQGKLLFVSSAAALSTLRAGNSPPIGFTISSSEVLLSISNLRRQAALTTETTAAISTVYGQTEADILGNIRTRLGEIQNVLINLNLIAS